jgi:hypothetical protein
LKPRQVTRTGIQALLLALAGALSGQELEPRAYAPNPSGATFALLAYGKSTGDVLLDTALPITDVTADLNATSLLLGRTFGLAGRSASFGVGVPYAWGSMEGNVGEEFRRITRSGLGDMRARFAVNLAGGPALEMSEFVKRTPRTTLGASLVTVIPTGQYAPSKLINIGANRWAFKPELGLSHPHGRWFLELYGGVWLFTANDDFFGGQHRKQASIFSFQAHVAYTFKRRLWLSGDATFYTGGQTTVNGARNADRQENSRTGLTLALPIGARHSVKLGWAKGISTRIGGDFNTFGVAWQTLWLPRAR